MELSKHKKVLFKKRFSVVFKCRAPCYWPQGWQKSHLGQFTAPPVPHIFLQGLRSVWFQVSAHTISATQESCPSPSPFCPSWGVAVPCFPVAAAGITVPPHMEASGKHILTNYMSRLKWIDAEPWRGLCKFGWGKDATLIGRLRKALTAELGRMQPWRMDRVSPYSAGSRVSSKENCRSRSKEISKNWVRLENFKAFHLQ